MTAAVGASRISLLPILAFVLAIGGCGDGGKTFTAQEFIDAVKAEGVELRLGDELVTDEQAKELYAVELDPVAELPGEAGADEHTAGSLSVYDDTGGADDEIENCRAAADLLCYQAANIVVVLEGGGIEAEQLGVAMQRLSGE
jgi:hypothetical protein